MHLADGLDAFAYSSWENNLLLPLLGWGPKLLRLIPRWEEGQVYGAHAFMDAYPFFRTHLLPRGHAYLLDRLLSTKKKGLLKDKGFRTDFEGFCETWALGEWKDYIPESNAPYAHQLNLDRDLLDFIRLSLQIHRIDKTTARRLKIQVDRALQTQF
jgi:hypothetical protein